MDVTGLLEVLDTAGGSRSELARRSGLSRNTEWLTRQDPGRANVKTIRELALACGYDLRIDLVPAYEPLAVIAARVLLGDLPAKLEAQPVNESDITAWQERLQRYAAPEDYLGIVGEAARLAAPQHSPEALFFAGRSDVRRLTSAAIASEAPWRLSGEAALDAMGAFGDGGPPEKLPVVVWSGAPATFGRFLAETHREVRVPGAADVVVAPLEWHHEVGGVDLDRTPLVSPVQAVIDSVGLGGGLAAAARRLMESW